MSDAELIARLRSIDHLSIEDCFLQSPLYAKAADRIEALEAKLSKTEGLLAMAMHVIKGRIHWEASGLTCDCGECQVLVATVAQIKGESHE